MRTHPNSRICIERERTLLVSESVGLVRPESGNMSSGHANRRRRKWFQLPAFWYFPFRVFFKKIGICCLDFSVPFQKDITGWNGTSFLLWLHVCSLLQSFSCLQRNIGEQIAAAFPLHSHFANNNNKTDMWKEMTPAFFYVQICSVFFQNMTKK